LHEDAGIRLWTLDGQVLIASLKTKMHAISPEVAEGLQRAVDLADVTAGTKLRVVPRIVREATGPRVRLEIDVEDGSLGDGARGPNVVRSTISTQAIVDVQQTLMIGGYHAESVSRNQQKVPVLGDVPLVGGLFRSTTASETTRERLFLITPRLVGTTGTTASERSKVGAKARTIAEAQTEFAEPPGQTTERAVTNTVRAESAPTPHQPSQVSGRNEMLPVAIRRESLQTSMQSGRLQPPVRSERVQRTTSSQPAQGADIGGTGFTRLDPVSGNPIEGAPAAKRKCVRPKGKVLTGEELA
jgi:hypothetical protein